GPLAADRRPEDDRSAGPRGLLEGVPGHVERLPRLPSSLREAIPQASRAGRARGSDDRILARGERRLTPTRGKGMGIALSSLALLVVGLVVGSAWGQTPHRSAIS